MALRTTILDYGVGNLRSVARALEFCGADAMLASTPHDAKTAERLVVPGVGAFGTCVAQLRNHGFEETIKAAVERATPILAICVGMQMLFEWSEEFGHHPGLAILPGRVIPIPRRRPDGRLRKVPHIGWAAIRNPEGLNADRWTGSLLDGTPEGTTVYFVHSFNCEPAIPADRLANAEYDGETISAAVQRGNLFGLQFHPEKSGPAGLAMLRRFLEV